MKTTFILITLFAIFFLSLKSKSQEEHYEVIGNIEGAEGVKFVLRYTPVKGMIFSDTSTVVNGHFKFIGGKVEYPRLVRLYSLGKNTKIGRYLNSRFFLENSTITITANYDPLSHMLKNTVISGSQTEDERNLIYSHDQVNVKTSERKALLKNFIKKYPKSYVAPLVLYEFCLFPGLRIEEVDSLINIIDPEIIVLPHVTSLKYKIDKFKIPLAQEYTNGSPKLWVQEINEKSNIAQKNKIMKFEEIERNDDYSIVRLTRTSGVDSPFFSLECLCNIARQRGKQFFIKLKDWKDPEGRSMSKVGFSDSIDIDLKKVFGEDLNEKLNKNSFNSIAKCSAWLSSYQSVQ